MHVPELIFTSATFWFFVPQLGLFPGVFSKVPLFQPNNYRTGFTSTDRFYRMQSSDEKW